MMAGLVHYLSCRALAECLGLGTRGEQRAFAPPTVKPGGLIRFNKIHTIKYKSRVFGNLKNRCVLNVPSTCMSGISSAQSVFTKICAMYVCSMYLHRTIHLSILPLLCRRNLEAIIHTVASTRVCNSITRSDHPLSPRRKDKLRSSRSSNSGRYLKKVVQRAP